EKIGPTISLEINDWRVNRAGLHVHHVALEEPISQIAQPTYFALIVAKFANDEVGMAITVQIGRANVSHARDMLEDRPWAKLPVPQIFEHDHRPNRVIVRENFTQTRYQHVEPSVARQVADRDVRRRFDSFTNLPFGKGS